MEKKIEEFKQFLKEKPKPNGEKYSEKYINWVCGLANRLPNPIRIDTINKFLKEQQWQPPACRAISTFMQWYLYGDIGKEIRDKMKERKIKIYVSPRKPRDLHTKILSFEEVKKLIDNAENLKTELIVRLLYDSAIRRAELLNIRVKDIDFDLKRILIKGKGGRIEPVYFLDKVRDLLKEYVNGKRGKIFKMSEFQLYYLIRNLGRDILGKNISPHYFRYSKATHLLDSGAKMEDVKKILRHKDIKTTEIYGKVSEKRVRKAFFKHSKEL